MPSKRVIIPLGILIAVIFLGLGVLIGYLFIPRNNSHSKLHQMDAIKNSETNLTITEKLLRDIKAENIVEFLRSLSMRPHMGGTEANNILGSEIATLWKQQGLEGVKLIPYRVLLSFPDELRENKVRIVDRGKGTIFSSKNKEDSAVHDDTIAQGFYAYSAPGTVEKKMVYANYGREEDFIWLINVKAITVSDTIVLLRLGHLAPSQKVLIAQKFGAAGVVIFPDPMDYAPEGMDNVYPKSWWLPNSGIIRGTSYFGIGDPLTPGYPSIDSAFRLNEKETKIPNIPVQPITYRDAMEIMSKLDGEEAPTDWQGKLTVKYYLGPNFKDPSWRIRMEIFTKNKITTIYNVVGHIRGYNEPDRYVLLGNQRDAWVYGAADPTSGTAALLELTNFFGKLAKEGWRPRRTLVFCSWGAAKYGLIGSTEWAEENSKVLYDRAVAYLNVDAAVQGTYSLFVRGSPLLYQVLFEAAKQILNPNKQDVAVGIKTIYDAWLQKYPSEILSTPGKVMPKIYSLGYDSDYVAFNYRLGVPCLDFKYRNKADFPVSHSAYDNFQYVKVFIDPDFTYHAVVTQLWGEVARLLVDSTIIPFNLNDYAFYLQNITASTRATYGKSMRENGIYFEYLESAVKNFSISAAAFQQRAALLEHQESPLNLRILNDQLLKIERAFLIEEGLPRNNHLRHVILSPPYHSSERNGFPGLADIFYDIDRAAERDERWKMIKRHFSILVFTIQSAATSLAEISL